MKRIIWLTCLLLSFCLGAAALTIYDVQYTASRGVDGSYPSPWLGKQVTLEGIVTATGYRGEGFFLSEKVSGAWRGIYVLDSRHHPAVGSYVRLTGEVAENYGMTCLRDLSSLKVLDRNRTLPSPVVISTGQLANPMEAEAYEGVYVRLVNASVTGVKSRNASFTVNDGSGQCGITLQSFGGKASTPAVGTQFAQIVGLVTFSYGEYQLNPVSAGGMQVQQPVSVQNRSWGKIKSIYK